MVLLIFEDILFKACNKTHAVTSPWFSLGLLLILLSLPAVGYTSESIVQSSQTQKTILVVGDSLSAAFGIEQKQGWVNLLQNRLNADFPHYQVVNASISGETTQGGASRIEGLLARFSPEIVIVELGGNDGLRGLPIKVIRESLEFIITTIKAQQIELLLLGMRLPPNYGIQYTRQFEALYQELAEQYQTELVPFFLKGFASDRDMIQGDGIHPKAEAQPIMLENVWPTLKAIL